jgi:uncharacterized protein (TIGR03435 family)
MNLKLILGLLAISARLVFAQAPASQLEFDAVEMRLNASGPSGPSLGLQPGGRFSLRYMTAAELVGIAYDVNKNAIAGAPAWFATDHFDIVAKGPANMEKQDVLVRLQSLLASELKLAIRREPIPQNAFALVTAKSGARLNAAAGSGQPVCELTFDGMQFHYVCVNFSMRDLAAKLPSMAPADIDRPVVDLTMLQGGWDFKLDWAGRAEADNTGAASIFGAIEQLGLRLEQRRLPLPGIVIERAERP